MDIYTFLKTGIIKTLYVNFHCCSFKDALHFPILVARNCSVAYCKKNSFHFPDGCRMGIFTIGFNRKSNAGASSALRVKGVIIVRGTGVHAFGSGCVVGVGSQGILEIGDHFCCTGDSRLSTCKHISIGKNNLWSYGCTIMDNDGHRIYDSGGGDRPINEPQDIIFGEDIWMGSGCLILKGSVIPPGCIIAAKSLISKPLTERNCIISSQGRIIKTNIHWKR